MSEIYELGEKRTVCVGIEGKMRFVARYSAWDFVSELVRIGSVGWWALESWVGEIWIAGLVRFEQVWWGG